MVGDKVAVGGARTQPFAQSQEFAVEQVILLVGVGADIVFDKFAQQNSGVDD